MRRRLLVIFGVVVAVAVAATWGVWRFAGLSGSSGVEDWVREYLVGVLRHHLNPQVEIGDLDYEYPRTVTLSRLRLTESGIDILAAEQVRLELAEIPRRGEPLLIQRIELYSPAVRLEMSPAGGLIGWSNLVRSGGAAPMPTPATGSAVTASFRVSDFMRLRHARIRNGSLAHRTDAGREETLLTGIHAEVDTPAAADGPGWYQLVGTLRREDLFDIGFDGRINVDDGHLVVNALRVSGQLDESKYSLFPASIQDLLRRHQVQGVLALDASGEWSRGADGQRAINVKGRLERTRFAYGPHLLASNRVDVQGDLSGDEIQAEAAGDVLEGAASVRFQGALGAQPGDLTVRLSAINLAQLLSLTPRQTQDAIEHFAFAGRVTGQVGAKIAWDGRLHAATADATMEPLHFRLAQVPVEAPKATLSGAIEEATRRLEFGADELRHGGQTVARTVRVGVSPDGTGAKVTAGLAAFGGQLDWQISTSIGTEPRYPYSLRFKSVAIQEIQSFLTNAGFGSARDLIRGVVTGELKGTLNRDDWAVSTCAGQISINDGRLQIAAEPLVLGATAVNVNLAERQLKLNGRLQAAGGFVDGEVELDLPRMGKIGVKGRAESVSLIPVLAATGQEWNRLPNGNSMVDGRVTGDFAFAIPTAGNANASSKFKLRAVQAYCTLNEMRIPIDQCDIDAELRDQRFAGKLHFDTFGGQAEIEGNLSLDPQREFSAAWQLRGVHLEKLAGFARTTKPRRYRGRLSGDGDVKGRASAASDTWTGRGRLEVKEGYLLDLPVIREIANLLKPAIALAGADNQDEARASFVMRQGAFNSDAFHVNSPLLAIRGRGQLHFDGRLDLVVRATPVPKLTGLLGPLDKLLDDASGRLVTYRVRGTTKKPEIRVEPLGLSMPGG